MSKSWLIFDIDDVLFDFVPIVYQKGIEHNKLKTSEHYLNWTSYNHLNYFDYDDADKFRDFVLEAQVLENFIATPGSKDFMYWASQHYELGFITARGFHPQAEMITREFLNSQLDVDGKIIISGLYGSNKSQYISEFPGMISSFIDDNATHVQDFRNNGISSVLRHQKWNENDHADVRIHNFDEFKNFLIRSC